MTLAAVLAIAAWIKRDAVLVAAADFWIVSDPIGPVDVAVVLGGGDERPFAAAIYYQQGLAKHILVSNPSGGPAEKLGVVQSNASANRTVLLKLGVPESAIETFGDDVKNTHDEAVALREWALRAGVHSFIIPTEIFAARRVSWIMRHELGDKMLIRVPALEPYNYHRDNWWMDTRATLAFQNEVIKYVYYRFKY